MQNILDPAILFFIFGVFAGAVRSNLEIPPAITKFLWFKGWICFTKIRINN